MAIVPAKITFRFLWAAPLGGAGKTYKTGRLCGNFPHTHSMAGTINGAMAAVHDLVDTKKNARAGRAFQCTAEGVSILVDVAVLGVLEEQRADDECHHRHE